VTTSRYVRHHGEKRHAAVYSSRQREYRADISGGLAVCLYGSVGIGSCSGCFANVAWNRVNVENSCFRA